MEYFTTSQEEYSFIGILAVKIRSKNPDEICIAIECYKSYRLFFWMYEFPE